MMKLADMTVTGFADIVSSDAPAPGGGSCAALYGAIGAALTLGLRGGGVLLSLLVLPLYIPVLIFGAGAVDATVSGLGGEGHLSLLAAMTFASLGFAPWASAAALKIALE